MEGRGRGGGLGFLGGFWGGTGVGGYVDMWVREGEWGIGRREGEERRGEGIGGG